jgi:signal transduction histidine kinase
MFPHRVCGSIAVSAEKLVPIDAGQAPPPAGKGASEPHRLRRRRDLALVGGVCAGVAEYLELEPLVVRVLFIVVAVASGGVGLVVYPLSWALIPAAPAAAIDGGSSQWRRRLWAWREALGLVLLVGAALLVLRRAGLWLGDEIILPLVLASCGVALILRDASAPDWAGGQPWRRPGVHGQGARRDPGWRRWPGGALGVALVFAAAVVFLHEAGILQRSRHAAGAIVVIVVAIALVFGPWFVRLARSVASERSERIRSEERADLAAHLHDSVLQTLALIQRRAGDPREVAGLARRQERELRHWLFERSDGHGATTFGAALDQAAVDVEALYKVRVEAVMVGDCPLDERMLATASAAREALTNAAKFAGGDQIDLYAEVGAQDVQVFVRDRGVGFDASSIPDDRRGVSHSILERMRQHGGRAEIRSEPGKGTEVELVMGRSPA